MKNHIKDVLLILVLLLANLVEGGSLSVGCGVASKDAIYELKELGKTPDSPWSINISDSESISFGICRAITPCYSHYSSTWAKRNENGNCQESMTQDGDPSYSKVTTGNASFVAINYTSLGLRCKKENVTYKFVVYIGCNKSISKENAIPRLLSSSQCSFEVQIDVDKGCSLVNLDAFWGFVRTCWPLFAIIYIIVGGLMGVFGTSMWNTITRIIFTMAFTVLFVAISYETLLPFDSPAWVICLVILISVALGVGFALMAAKYQEAGFLLLGAWLGASFTIVLENIVLRFIAVSLLFFKMKDTQLVKGAILSGGLFLIPLIYNLYGCEITFWISMGSTIGLCAGISYSLKEFIINIATSFIGAYLVISGISFFIGGFPSALEMYNQIQNHNVTYSFTLAIYAVFIFLLTIGFVITQERFIAKRKQDALMSNENEDDKAKPLHTL